MNSKLVWITPDAEKLITYMARVSNPNAKPDDPAKKLIFYLMDHKHWSPFEMASACVEINTTRDIARQILRHRSFHFQEFSQRYANIDSTKPIYREARLSDPKNRQNSIKFEGGQLHGDWADSQEHVFLTALKHYNLAIEQGIAKEVARALLPEGLTPTKMYMQGTIRDWLHYISIRTGVETQYEHRVIANEIRQLLQEACPSIFEAAQQNGLIEAAQPLDSIDHGSGGDRHGV